MRVLANPCVTMCSCLLDALKLQFVEAGVPEALSEMIRTLQGGSDTHDLCSIKVASNLIVSLLLGGMSLSIISANIILQWIFLFRLFHYDSIRLSTLDHNIV